MGQGSTAGRALFHFGTWRGVAGTVAQNIARFDPNADPKAIIAAAQAANMHSLILRLPEGCETQIGESGQALSAGQRQRIAPGVVRPRWAAHVRASARYFCAIVAHGLEVRSLASDMIRYIPRAEPRVRPRGGECAGGGHGFEGELKETAVVGVVDMVGSISADDVRLGMDAKGGSDLWRTFMLATEEAR
jgi:hypothetical protein